MGEHSNVRALPGLTFRIQGRIYHSMTTLPKYHHTNHGSRDHRYSPEMERFTPIKSNGLPTSPEKRGERIKTSLKTVAYQIDARARPAPFIPFPFPQTHGQTVTQQQQDEYVSPRQEEEDDENDEDDEEEGRREEGEEDEERGYFGSDGGPRRIPPQFLAQHFLCTAQGTLETYPEEAEALQQQQQQQQQQRRLCFQPAS
ncbi:hypothetical protein BZA05DRAFT_437273 [Tricharina praecox]|uniref:uncharacterized protein n=1 Tax=Tricharina praecox TaxID=43433 RepID=UPI00221F8570|nr:uncharacterized protein BZA05DRAFT_437273 [Tricharina praecox]KAI5849201.1 hypothetical protein BZA05DRAFT_437273 [Tricharina praecox]